MSVEDQCCEMTSSDSPAEIKIFKPFDEVKKLLLKKRKYQKMRYTQMMRWRQEFKAGNALVEQYARTDYKLNETKAELDSLTELVNAFYDDMEKLKKAILEQRKKDQREFTKRVADLLYYEDIVTWLQKPKVREAFYDGTNGIKVLNEREVAILESLHEIINPRINLHTYEEIWKRTLRNVAELGTELMKDQDETTIVHSNVCKNDVKFENEMSNIEVAETDVQLETESLTKTIGNLIMNNWCYPHIPSICIGMLLVIVTSAAHNFLS